MTKAGRKPINGVSPRVYSLIAIDSNDKVILDELSKKKKKSKVDLLHELIQSIAKYTNQVMPLWYANKCYMGS